MREKQSEWEPLSQLCHKCLDTLFSALSILSARKPALPMSDIDVVLLLMPALNSSLTHSSILTTLLNEEHQGKGRRDGANIKECGYFFFSCPFRLSNSRHPNQHVWCSICVLIPGNLSVLIKN